MLWPSEVTAAERQCLTCTDLFACVMGASCKHAAETTICMPVIAFWRGSMDIVSDVASTSHCITEELRG
jgi:hypothetical protein